MQMLKIWIEMGGKFSNSVYKISCVFRACKKQMIF
jgi:hypothetical protein